jgi:hypothetical protein
MSDYSGSVPDNCLTEHLICPNSYLSKQKESVFLAKDKFLERVLKLNPVVID